ncbi:MAG: helix-turn-helix domain-containing protein [Bacteroidia bacterium]|nr:helix-turn-helix domain-containing protein [Bacteroidia bacterium]
MEKYFKNFENPDRCPVRNILSRFGDKWSLLIIHKLGESGTLRFSELRQEINDISQKMLTVTLRTLEADGLVKRTIYPEIPPRVEYNLTDLGKSLLPVLAQLSDWANTHMEEIIATRSNYALRIN